MLDKPHTSEQAVSKSGMLPRPIVLDQKLMRETPPPTSMNEVRDEGATTGIMTIVVEGEDDSAERDDDKGN